MRYADIIEEAKREDPLVGSGDPRDAPLARAYDSLIEQDWSSLEYLFEIEGGEEAMREEFSDHFRFKL
tara:strand:+ start:539 stop:742 length:204 start_codon:yes stop_codon:yes gene_type:complete